MRVEVHRSAVAQLGNRDNIARQVPTEQLTHICTAPQAVVARAALGCARDAHTIPNLDAPHLGSDGLHDTNAAVSLHEGHVIRVRTGEADGSGIALTRCRRCGLQSKYGSDVRVAQVAGLSADDDLSTRDRTAGARPGGSCVRDPYRARSRRETSWQ